MFNARSLVNKMADLHLLLYSNKYDIILVTETWLHDGVTSGLLDPCSLYTVLRKDRILSNHGGVAAFIAKEYNIIEVDLDPTFTNLELLCFDIVFPGSKLRLFVVYRPPYYDVTANDYVTLLVKFLTQFSARDYVNIIVGDFNCPKINWTGNCPANDYVSKSIFNWAVCGGFTQFVNFATRGQNVLDLVLADDDQIVSHIYPSPPFGLSDHCIVNFTITVEHKCPAAGGLTEVTKRYKWHKADFETFAHYIERIDWYDVVRYNPCALSSWSAFLSIIWDAAAVCVPISNSPAGKLGQKHYPRDLQKLIVKKRQLWRKHRNNPSDLQALWKYRDCAQQYRTACLNEAVMAEERIIQANNLGVFYKHINQRVRHRQSVPALMGNDGHIITTDDSKAKVFNEYFASVGIVDDGRKPIGMQIQPINVLDNVVFDERNVLSAIQKLKPNLSAGPDGLPPLLFKRVQASLARPLVLLFTQLLSVGMVPDTWKQAIIVPVFKKGPTSAVSNYRPISLTCVASKIMERVIAKQIFEYLLSNNLLASIQHGFIKGRSTCTNLLESVNDWTISVQNKKCVTVAYIDFSRAFDTVSHEKLFMRLAAYGIQGSLLQWLKNFFVDRTHRTKVGCCISGIVAMISGIIQGSGLGPVMFIIYIDDLAKLLERNGITAKFFADDVKVYCEISDANDSVCLQNALDIIANWAKEWQLSISVTKCNILSIGNTGTVDTSEYYINDCQLPRVTACRDLGIIVTSDLSPCQHINEIVNKAHQRANHIIRCFVSGQMGTLIRAFIVYVRPILEYNCVVWSPSLKKDIDLIEKVQRRFTKRLHGLKDLPYTERLQRVDLPSLELRRLHLDLTFCYNIVFNHMCVNFDDFFTISPSSQTRGHPYKLYKPRCTNSTRCNFFAARVIDVWNHLPPTVSFSSVSAFKKSIKKVDFSSYLKCTL